MTEQEWKDEVAKDLEAFDVPDVLARLDFHWERYSGKPDNIRFLYTKRALMQALINHYRRAVDRQTGADKVAMSQMIKNIQTSIGYVTSEINETDVDRKKVRKVVSSQPLPVSADHPEQHHPRIELWDW